jgi:hypothetical protein
VGRLLAGLADDGRPGGVLDAYGLPRRGDGGAVPGAPGLACVGFEPAVTGRLPQLPAQARRAARTVLAALPG